MKKIYLTLITTIIIVHLSFAQWTTSGSNIYNTNTGDVGIGTTTPASLLHLTSLTIVPLITLTKTGIINWKLGNFNQSADNGFSIGFNNLIAAYFDNGGRMGLGTITPNAQLDVYNTVSGSGLRVGGNANGLTNGTSDIAGIDLYANAANSTPSYSRITLGITSSTPSSETGFLTFSTINTGSLSEKMRITSTGSIGIGTTTPSSLLSLQQSASFPLISLVNISAGTWKLGNFNPSSTENGFSIGLHTTQ